MRVHMQDWSEHNLAKAKEKGEEQAPLRVLSVFGRALPAGVVEPFVGSPATGGQVGMP